MHMADALITPAVGGVMWTISAGSIAVAAKKLRETELEEKKVPLMGIMGAFVFAAQMINFSIPGTGSSGHIGGGILLAAILGSIPCFNDGGCFTDPGAFFADGGLLAHGCNLFNLGVLPCLIGYPLIFRPLMKGAISQKRLMLASILTVVVSLQAGALSVVLQTTLSGISALPFTKFIVLMLPIHLAIGLVEGVVSGMVLWFLFETRAEMLDAAMIKGIAPRISTRTVVLFLVIATLVTGGFFSLYASSHPDGLEWAIERVSGLEELEAGSAIHEQMADIQNKSAFMPDYDYPEEAKKLAINGTTAAGIVGSGIVFLLAVSGWLIRHGRKKNSEA